MEVRRRRRAAGLVRQRASVQRDAARPVEAQQRLALAEWERLQLRDAQRPDFIVYTGNDFAIDMIIYGSDYLLGLSTFAPDLFAQRDAYWASGDARFYELNDQLQYLGQFAFRRPSPGYKHSAAQFLKLRGWIHSDRTHPDSPDRPASDIEILREIGQRLNVILPADKKVKTA